MEILEVGRNLTAGETEDLWNQVREYPWNRRKLLACVTIPEAFIRKHWGEFKEEEHCHLILYQKLSTLFLLNHWNILTEDERKACFEHQKLSTEFLESKWRQMKPDNWLVAGRAQILAPEFITSRWPLMDWWWKVKAIGWQKKFPARLVIENWDEAMHPLFIKHYWRRVKGYYCEDLTMAELPEYLSCVFNTVRTSAEEWLCELQRREQHAYEQAARASR